MAPRPIIFAMANPDPEITPPDAKAARPTRSSPPAGRTIRTRSTTCSASRSSFRGALDVRATTINDEMKIAAAQALRRTRAPARCPRK
jgi:malate dehydrogenase (oxaloacetate-decarboxylating)(NADP+)